MKTAELNGKVALVTGAGSGIGRAVALRYARAGARVVVSDRDAGSAEATAALLRQAGGEALVQVADVRSWPAHESLVAATLAAFGRLDVACNNAGIAGASAPLAELALDDWQLMLDINLTGVFLGMRAQIPALLQSGGGAIVNLSSILGQVGFSSTSAYSAAKHGVIGLSRSAALDYAQQGLRINCVLPGFIDTPMVRDAMPAEHLAAMAQLHPIGRLGTAEEVAELVLWLSSPAASFSTGGVFSADGGYLAR